MKLFIADNYNLTREELDVFRAMGYEITVARPNQAPARSAKTTRRWKWPCANTFT